MPSNPLNVFRGPDSLAQFLDPDSSPPLPLVELPGALNPLRRKGVRIYAKLLTQLPAQNVKSLPARLTTGSIALNMLQNEHNAQHQRIVEASSGSTVLSQAMIARALWNHEDVHAFVTNKKHPDSLKLLRFFGIKVNLYGGLAQQEPYDPKGIMARLRRLAETDSTVCYPGQYHNDCNWKSHEQWTGAQIWKQLPEVRVFASTVGTGGCAVGTGSYLKSRNPAVQVVGVCNVFGDPTPGPRHFPNFESSPFPWRQTIDHFESVASVDSYRTSMKLSRYGLIAGPSSGEALHGLLVYLEKTSANNGLDNLRDPATGEIHCVFVCADLPYQYMDMYYRKLPAEEFPPIQNEVRYDMEDLLCSRPSPCLCRTLPGEIPDFSSGSCSLISDSSSCDSSAVSHSVFSTPQSPAGHDSELQDFMVLDLRPDSIFGTSHLRHSYNFPLPMIKDDLFGDAKAVQQRWMQLNGLFNEESWLWTNKREMLVLCGDGDSSRMATAMLRAKGCEAYCVEGGFPALELTYVRMIDARKTAEEPAEQT
ncbi:tryptophan synthase beta subunit-like PLP-dependent enzyme [Westerdykella ornata]|uniref:Tryptophan synthase beta subunit-like PLP-dependent enzyme n=1 Tax=Westerdykella ornata TaxID=318751 RepID=A0A6A6J729_WESOR|nr:tryptophan synthase beta subunit-like PLP-dependent enzyme [Westerdykella ornata]KAF2271446.1 tryptophan synthase beta subunit-like PLP-dependent enzyme [Westerdykella ornata]